MFYVPSSGEDTGAILPALSSLFIVSATRGISPARIIPTDGTMSDNPEYSVLT